MGQIPKPMHDVANRNSRSEKEPTYGTSYEIGNGDCFSLPSMS